MNIIICLDDKNGIRFNGRRQSRDSVLCERVLAMAKGGGLYMSEDSAKMFPFACVKAQDGFLSFAKAGDFCFVEDDEFLRCSDRFERVIVYRWNKVYPSDLKVDTRFLDKMKLVSSTDFKGSSHERITEEIYE